MTPIQVLIVAVVTYCTVTHGQVPPRVVTAQYSCAKLPYKSTCSTGFPSQFALRWFAMNGKCCSFPYGHCKGEDDTLTNPAIRTKADCEEICIKGGQSSTNTGVGRGPGSSSSSGSPSGSSPSGSISVGSSAPGSVPSGPVSTKYSCNRLAYKATCSTGFPSQFALRWFAMNGKCCSYPYGHCKGEDDTVTSPSIRSKADCESICISGVTHGPILTGSTQPSIVGPGGPSVIGTSGPSIVNVENTGQTAFPPSSKGPEAVTVYPVPLTGPTTSFPSSITQPPATAPTVGPAYPQPVTDRGITPPPIQRFIQPLTTTVERRTPSPDRGKATATLGERPNTETSKSKTTPTEAVSNALITQSHPITATDSSISFESTNVKPSTGTHAERPGATDTFSATPVIHANSADTKPSTIADLKPTTPRPSTNEGVSVTASPDNVRTSGGPGKVTDKQASGSTALPPAPLVTNQVPTEKKNVGSTAFPVPPATISATKGSVGSTPLPPAPLITYHPNLNTDSLVTTTQAAKLSPALFPATAGQVNPYEDLIKSSQSTSTTKSAESGTIQLQATKPTTVSTVVTTSPVTVLSSVQSATSNIATAVPPNIASSPASAGSASSLPATQQQLTFSSSAVTNAPPVTSVSATTVATAQTSASIAQNYPPAGNVASSQTSSTLSGTSLPAVSNKPTDKFTIGESKSQTVATAIQTSATAIQISATAIQTSATTIQTSATTIQTVATGVQTSATPIQSAATSGQPAATASPAVATAIQSAATSGQPAATASPAVATAIQSAATSGQPAATASPAVATAIQSAATSGQPAATASPAVATAIQSAATSGQPAATASPAVATAISTATPAIQTAAISIPITAIENRSAPPSSQTPANVPSSGPAQVTVAPAQSTSSTDKVITVAPSNQASPGQALSTSGGSQSSVGIGYPVAGTTNSLSSSASIQPSVSAQTSAPSSSTSAISQASGDSFQASTPGSINSIASQAAAATVAANNAISDKPATANNAYNSQTTQLTASTVQQQQTKTVDQPTVPPQTVGQQNTQVPTVASQVSQSSAAILVRTSAPLQVQTSESLQQLIDAGGKPTAATTAQPIQSLYTFPQWQLQTPIAAATQASVVQNPVLPATATPLQQPMNSNIEDLFGNKGSGAKPATAQIVPSAFVPQPAPPSYQPPSYQYGGYANPYGR